MIGYQKEYLRAKCVLGDTFLADFYPVSMTCVAIWISAYFRLAPDGVRGKVTL